MQTRRSYNPKRRIASSANSDSLMDLISKVRYGGNPEHKRNPGDFDLTPPSSPRMDKACCDDVAIFSKGKALRLLKKGLQKGLVSKRQNHGFPQNIWSVTAKGEPLEAQLENAETGTYHGYPLPGNDPFRAVVLQWWNQ
ncbi:MAG TPA: hypothetical protein ENI62_05995 [Gammaproteobacteria bacterium]|nr:hypothetical protein [Gammaproteobacteria bacterium]